MNKSNRREFIIRLLILASAILFVVYFHNVLNFIKWSYNMLFPIILALGMAYIWNLIMDFLEKKVFVKIENKKFQKFKRPLSMLISLIFIIVLIMLVLYLIIPQMYNSIKIIGETIPKLLDDIYAWVMKNPEKSEIKMYLKDEIGHIAGNWSTYQAKIVEYAKSNIGGFIGSTVNVVSTVLGTIVTGFTSLIIAVYILASKESLSRNIKLTMKAYLPERKYEKILNFLRIMDEKFSAFFKGQFIDAIVIGLILYGVMLLLKLPYAMTISVVVAVTALIPMLGSLIGGAIGVLMIAAVNFNQAIIFLIALIIVQQFESNLIYPKLVGDSVGLPGVWTFVAVIVGGAIAGPLGMLLFVPLMAGFYKIIRRDVKKRITNKE